MPSAVEQAELAASAARAASSESAGHCNCGDCGAGGPKSLQEPNVKWLGSVRLKLPFAVIAGILLIAVGLSLSAVTLMGVPEDRIMVVACGYPAVGLLYALWVGWSRTR